MLAIVSVFPTDKGASVSAYVARAVDAVAASGLSYKVTAMGTILEGEPDAVFDALKAAHAAVAAESERVYMTVAIDDRRGATDRIAGKVSSLERRLGRELDEVGD